MAKRKRKRSKKTKSSVAANRKRFGTASRECMKTNDNWSAFGRCMKSKL